MKLFALPLWAATFAVLFSTTFTQAQQPHKAAQHEKVLYTFRKASVGFIPSALVRDAKGNLFGTNFWGGNTKGICSEYRGCGTVFELTATGKLIVLHTFDWSDGANPYNALIQDANGTLYGTALRGGSYSYGAIFKISPAGKFTLLHSFNLATEGGGPLSLSMDAQGNLYGAAGTYTNAGEIFEFTTAGKLEVLYKFAGGIDGYGPSGVIPDNEGNLYGATGIGGDLGCRLNDDGCGVLYKLDINSGVEMILYSFHGDGDGAFPSALIRDRAGCLYGTTGSGATNGNIFKLTAAGAFDLLYTFDGIDGDGPNGVMKGPYGYLHGTTKIGGNGKCNDGLGCGLVFQLSPRGEESVSYNFQGGPDGAYPQVGLVEDSNYNLYGTTISGGDLNCHSSYGDAGCGVIFEITAN